MGSPEQVSSRNDKPAVLVGTIKTSTGGLVQITKDEDVWWCDAVGRPPEYPGPEPKRCVSNIGNKPLNEALAMLHAVRQQYPPRIVRKRQWDLSTARVWSKLLSCLPLIPIVLLYRGYRVVRNWLLPLEGPLPHKDFGTVVVDLTAGALCFIVVAMWTSVLFEFFL